MTEITLPFFGETVGILRSNAAALNHIIPAYKKRIYQEAFPSDFLAGSYDFLQIPHTEAPKPGKPHFMKAWNHPLALLAGTLALLPDILQDEACAEEHQKPRDLKYLKHSTHAAVEALLQESRSDLYKFSSKDEGALCILESIDTFLRKMSNGTLQRPDDDNCHAWETDEFCAYMAMDAISYTQKRPLLYDNSDEFPEAWHQVDRKLLDISIELQNILKRTRNPEVSKWYKKAMETAAHENEAAVSINVIAETDLMIDLSSDAGLFTLPEWIDHAAKVRCFQNGMEL